MKPGLQPYSKSTGYSVGWEVAEEGREVYNHLEDARYTTAPGNNIVLTGTRGEQWVTSEAKLRATYDGIPARPLAPGDGGSASPMQPESVDDIPVVWMRPAEGQEKVATSWGDELTANLPGRDHGTTGDMVAYADKGGIPDMSDSWIVNGAVFEDTYVTHEEAVEAFKEREAGNDGFSL